MTYIVLGILRERRPMLYYLGSAICFVLSQLAWFLLGKVICRVRIYPSAVDVVGPHRLVLQNTHAKIDGSFIATILETAAVGLIYLGWRSITEGTCSKFTSMYGDVDVFPDTWDDYY